MKKIARNTTRKTRYSVVQTLPIVKVVGHHHTRERAEMARCRYLRKPHGSGVGPIVEIYEMQPGEYLTPCNR